MREALLLVVEPPEDGLEIRRSSPKSLGRRNVLCGVAALMVFALDFTYEVSGSVDA
jgi:hypothetical protein